MSEFYTAMPASGQFKADTSVPFAIRSKDEALIRIDRFLEEYHRSKSCGGTHCGFVLCDLFLAINAWVKRYNAMNTHRRVQAVTNHTKPSAQVQPGFASVGDSASADAKKRYPGVLKLFDIVVKTLASLEITKNNDETRAEATMADHTPPDGGADWSYGVRYNRIIDMVMELVSIGMKGIGFETDTKHDMQPFSDNQLVEYRVWFKRGKTYQIDWWNREPTLRLKPANSSHAFNPDDKGAWGVTKNYGPFVMNMDLEMYMTQHSKEHGRFHSCYVNQKPVLMAGTILIENGTIKGIRCDSGHYQPTSHEFSKFLMHLKALGVQLANVDVFDHKGTLIAKAGRMLGGWFNPPKVLEGAYVEVEA